MPSNVLSNNDAIVLDRLLSRLAGSLHGAVDFWTVVCLGDFLPDRRAFIVRQTEVMKALVIVLKSFLTEADKEPIHGLLERISFRCEQLESVFLVLADIRAVGLEEIRLATTSLREVYTDLNEAIHQLSQAIGVPVSFWQNWTPERRSYFNNILEGLYDQFRHVVTSDPSATIAATPDHEQKTSCA
jgi:hypothetical protein